MMNDGIPSRGLRSAHSLAADRPHGDRLRYMAGCHCAECRAANSRYENERQKARRNGDWNGVVDAAPARKHIRFLSRRGLGRRAIAAASDIREQTIQTIRRGYKTRIRARTLRRILDVTPDLLADHALVRARRLWSCIRRLQEEGYTKTRLAQLLGYSKALQFRKTFVTARNEHNVLRLYERLMA